MKIKHVTLSLILLYTNVNCNLDKHNPVEKIFTQIYKTNQWGSRETVSGPGSELRFTQKMSQKLSALIKLFGITSLADAPCGDLNWMRYVDIGTCKYIG